MTEVIEKPFPVGGLEIQRTVAIRPNKDNLVFRIAIDGTADAASINEQMDVISEVVEREILKSQLIDKRAALEVAMEQPRNQDQEIQRLRTQRATYIASRMAQHEGRRLGWDEKRANEPERKALEQFDAQIQNAELAKKNFAADIPIIRWEIGCLEARIAGTELPEKPKELEERLHEMGMVA